MILVAGLGNIGKEYENTRHNAGFMLVDLFLENSQAPIISNSKFQGEVRKLNSTLFLKPHTYMNLSGKSIKAVYDFYKCQRLIVIHDDIDLSLGTLKFKKGGGNGGHNGLKNIDLLLGNSYERIRIGIGKNDNVLNYVLGEFKEEEKKILAPVLEAACKALNELLKNDDLAYIASKFSLRAKKEV
ncbi:MULTISPECIES: aminoacyl-tRNA hydrolase [unclassified Campylobacter]|uniref:aminoacyl-tRNA hydrolase n=1 Tax=unclassified Campylobacter TaxID=2593542 RepID=UPI00123834A4|nr:MULTISPECIES: aminoacyl-tRNA hydrolase [unclassified Campylobacter]KAA6227207.1 aminoacyl-tRNA hydrolase [Campylobacter sp. LR286c]KAA6227919.1 aminoacyl-tRNA hydrolase [Campylobacter sp. LR185c]KAA6228328.1 aminoacyl-tRNA hydrolase [Campylobacter sp. LR196d]KAA6229329.1 aminoacyl-tRNA hydrolase [Campylobacter sp. LR291e]KAA8604394.1 aminoacyl-tRNA hydrolase [Campylobacter sp. LR185c]